MLQDSNNKGIFMSLDWFTIGLYIVMITWGWFSICGACYDYGNPDLLSFDLKSGKQFVWILTAIALAGALLLIEKRFYYNASTPIYIMMMLILIITIFIAPDTKGSRSWIPIGPIKLQPAEFSKFAVALAIGKYMERYGFNMKSLRGFLKVASFIIVPMLFIIAQKETGSALVFLSLFFVLYREGMTGSVLFAGVAFITYFIVGIKYADLPLGYMPVSTGEFWVLLLSLVGTIMLVWFYGNNPRATRNMALFSIGATVVALLFSAYVIPFDVCIAQLIIMGGVIIYLIVIYSYSRHYRYLLFIIFAIASSAIFYGQDYVFHEVLGKHQRDRIEVLLGMNEDIRNEGYNVHQAKIAIGSGGLAGKGFLKGTQTKLHYVPEQDTDFIFCTVGEEEGFIGAAGVLMIYLVFILRLIVLAERQPDTWGRVYGYSVVSIFLFHLTINIGMVLGIAPVIGIPLPFFSYGGSSLWGFTILLFIFLRMDAERNFKRQ